jgi:hypothetical protein
MVAGVLAWLLNFDGESTDNLWNFRAFMVSRN